MLITILGTLLLGLLALTALLYPKWILSLLPLFFPLALIRFNIGSIPFSFLETLLWVIAIAALIQERSVFYDDKCLRKIRSLFFKYPPLLAMTIFFIVSTISLAFTPGTITFNTGVASSLWEHYETFKISLGIWKGWIVPLFLYVVLISFYTQIKRDTQVLQYHRYAYIASAVCVALVGILFQYGIGITTTLDGRLGGIFVSANYMVFYIAPAFFLAFIEAAHVLHKKYLAPKGLALVFATIVLLVALLFTRSYASWIAIIIVSTLWIWKITTVKQRAIVAVVAVLLFAGLIYKEKDSEKFRAFTVLAEQSSTSTRVEVYDISVQLLKEYWLMGLGMGSYEAVYKTEAVRILGKQPYEWVMLHPHNIYLSWWLFTGVFGFLALLLLLVTSLWKGIASGALAAFPLLYIALHGLVDTPFWKLDAMLIFFLVVLLVWQEKEQSVTISSLDV